MSRNDYCETVAEDFYAFARRFDEQASDERLYRNFQDYVAAWIEQGDAIEVSGGDYGTFMSGVVLAIARYVKDPSQLDYQGSSYDRERRVEGIIDLDDSSACFMDRSWWQRWTYPT